MKRQTITTQMKKQTRNLEFQINVYEIGELPGKELRIMMKRQRNTAQMKEQTRNTEVQINEEEIGNCLKKNSE